MKCDLSCGLFVDALYQVEAIPLHPNLLRLFITDFPFYQMSFLHQLISTYNFSSLACWYEKLHWFPKSNQLCITGIMVYNLFKRCWSVLSLRFRNLECHPYCFCLPFPHFVPLPWLLLPLNHCPPSQSPYSLSPVLLQQHPNWSPCINFCFLPTIFYTAVKDSFFIT